MTTIYTIKSDFYPVSHGLPSDSNYAEVTYYVSISNVEGRFISTIRTGGLGGFWEAQGVGQTEQEAMAAAAAIIFSNRTANLRY